MVDVGRVRAVDVERWQVYQEAAGLQGGVMIKYEAEWSDYSGGKINKFEVVTETNAQVVIQYKEKPWNSDKERTYERRRNKISNNSVIVDTWEEAYKYILDRATAYAQSARRQLERANGLLGNVMSMKKP